MILIFNKLMDNFAIVRWSLIPYACMRTWGSVTANVMACDPIGQLCREHTYM